MEICLLCLEMRSSSDKGIQLESLQWQDENLDIIIEKHFWPLKTISNNAWLCTTCWLVIKDFHEFYNRIEYAHACYISVLKTEKQEGNELQEFYVAELKEEETKTVGSGACLDLEMPIAAEQKDMETAVQSVENVLSDFEEKQSDIKKEYETEDFIKENHEIVKSKRIKGPLKSDPLKRSVKARKCKSFVNRKIEKPKKSSDISERNYSNRRRKDTINYTVNVDDESKSGSDSNCEEKSNSNQYYQPSTKYKDQDEFVATNFKLNCGICQATYEKFQDVCKHSAKEHQQRGFVVCCSKKFFRRSILVEHIHWHLDPEYFKCRDCGKVMADRRCLNIHSRVHEKIDRTHICDECGKTFARALALQRHKLIHLPDDEKKHTCDQCGKNFGDNNLLSNHKRSVHLNKYALVCDMCGRRMRSKEVFERHMLKHEGLPLPTVSCDVCGLKMTDPRSLKRHKEIQHPEGDRIEYKCQICSKVSPTLKAHKKHVQYKHELGYNFKCTVCEKAFKRAISLTEHMATHTGTVLYTCPYCPKTFNSNANMHNHRKKAHPKEWEEACRAKYSGNLPPNYKPTNALS